MCKNYFEVIILSTLFCFTTVYSNTKNCIINVGNAEINIGILNKESGYEFINENKAYYLNICGIALRCKQPNVSACVINTKNNITILGLLHGFNLKKNKLTYKYGKTKTIIELKCNRHMATPHIHYDTTNVFSENVHKFDLYTSTICVKIPTQCKVLDIENNEQYDITSLYNENYNWLVKNVSEVFKIYLNLCGNLHSISGAKNNECTYEGTQICLVDQNENFKNLGVFSSLLQPTEDGVSLNFTGGSLCGNFSTLSTKINFVCSFNDSGPIVTFSSDCEYIIKWHTPAACPYYMSINNNCTFQNKLLYLSKDKIQQLSPNLKIKYNICGVLHDTCHGQNNVGVCLIKDDEEIILGMSNSTVISKDGSISIKLNGELCVIKNVNHSVYIQFRCDYNTQEKLEKISLSTHDFCSAKITVFTTNACRLPDVLINKQCTVSVNDSHYYNLSSLVLKNRNYEITDPNDTTIIYLLNICQPIVYEANALCAVGSAICLRNNVEPNKYKRFKSLGNLESSELQIHNEKLIIQFENVMCPYPHVNRPNYKTVIEFQCVHHLQKSEIELKSKFDCEYIFLWKTQHACPIEVTTNITSTTIEPNTENVEQVANTMYEKNHDNNENFTTESIVNTNPFTIWMHVPIDDINFSRIFIKNCSIRDNFHKLNMYNMHNLPQITHVLSKSGKSYALNICNKTVQGMCTSSMLCLTNVHIALNKQFVIMNFTEDSDSWCNNRSYTSVIFLKCSIEFEKPVVIQEQECSVHLEWKNQAACAFLKDESQVEESHIGNTGRTIALSFVLILVAIILCVTGFTGYYYFTRKRRHESSLQLLRCEYSRVKDATKIA